MLWEEKGWEEEEEVRMILRDASSAFHMAAIDKLFQIQKACRPPLA